jgi:hypothetical protein
MTQPDEADSAISMDDILGVGSGFGDESPSSKAEDSASDFGVSALFEAPTGRSKPPSESRPKPDESDPFAGTPFADILGPGATGESPTNRESSNGPEPPGAPSSLDLPQMPDDDSAGGFSIPAPDADPFAGYAKAAADDIQRKQATSTGADPNSSTAIPSTGSPDGVVFTQNFAEDTVGDRPSGWEGDFPFASLEVRDDSPPKGAKKYLAFHKKIQGEGKVYFQRRFADLSGVIGVEFDLKCNQKNKFLLGFFVEKDEDFQQSVHTKILLSEAQTAPTILLHGEPAPYLLGSWAHVRYVIDLAKGKIDGYIDGTHIARGLKMPQRPKSLNTLAIRDSVNTTGELFIGNIEVKKIG